MVWPVSLWVITGLRPTFTRRFRFYSGAAQDLYVPANPLIKFFRFSFLHAFNLSMKSYRQPRRLCRYDLSAD
jgi:hypothetical protein